MENNNLKICLNNKCIVSQLIQGNESCMENQPIVCINIFVKQFINACSLYIYICYVNVIYCNETIVCHKYSQFIHGQKMPVFTSVSSDSE